MKPRAMSEWTAPAAPWGRGPRGTGQARTSSLDAGRTPANGRSRAPGDLPEPEALDEGLAAVDLLLGEIQAVQDRLLRQEGEAADGAGVIVREIGPADRRLGFERGLEAQQDGLLPDVGVRALLLDGGIEALQPALHHLEG